MSSFPLIIEELSGPSPQTIRLNRPSIPEKDLVERIEANTARSIYPGASEASIQVLSVENKPLIFKGLLSERFDDCDHVNGVEDCRGVWRWRGIAFRAGEEILDQMAL